MAVISRVLSGSLKCGGLKQSNLKQKPFEPDYLCFLAYAHTVLDYVYEKHPHVEKGGLHC
jgi:hypothetical protein